jgi:hypothetical protein
MLDALKKWIGAASPARRQWESVAQWAERRQATFRVASKGEGFTVEGRTGAVPWRLEWGPSQRPYVTGTELRLRGDLGLPADLQVLLLNRPLAEALEKAVFDEYVEGVQTRIDTSAPPEMRWLVMFPKVAGADLKALRARYAAVASHKAWVLRWLEGAFAEELAKAPGEVGDPVVWMVGRGRMMLRTALPVPEPEAIKPWLALFETALRQARRAQAELGDPPSPSTQPSLWPASAMPGDAGAPPLR